MTQSVKTLEEARALLEEYRSLPDDLTTRLNWDGYDRLPSWTTVCSRCGSTKSRGVVDMDALAWMVDKGEFNTTITRIWCDRCEPAEAEDEEDEEEPDDED